MTMKNIHENLSDRKIERRVTRDLLMNSRLDISKFRCFFLLFPKPALEQLSKIVGKRAGAWQHQPDSIEKSSLLVHPFEKRKVHDIIGLQNKHTLSMKSLFSHYTP